MYRISLQALSYGIALRKSCGSQGLWEKLYRFNRAPDAHSAGIETVSDKGGKDFVEPLLDRSGGDWSWTQQSDKNWIFLAKIDRRVAADAARRRNGRFKLYVSPAVGAFDATVRSVANVSDDCALMKFARTRSGTRRPDKIILYTESLDQTRSLAVRILSELGEVAAHGVPFTTELGGGGLVSWAMDPLSSDNRPFSSWRIWVSHMIVRCMDDVEVTLSSDRLLDAVRDQLSARFGVSAIDWALEPALRRRF